MYVSYNWLKDLIQLDLSPSDLARKLTESGLAVESIQQIGDDYILDFDLTSNRADCLSHLGIAREIRALTGSEISLKIKDEKVPDNSNKKLVNIEAPDLCHRFTARVIKNVKVRQSPEWLIRRLETVGERSINNIADITNYVMHELGQPMHAFDLNKLEENRIVVRRARDTEQIVTLDNIPRNLDRSMLAICDARKPVAIAGIMGGAHSAISTETTDVLLEVAYFDKNCIRQTSRKLKLSTEASHRFERGVDIENLIRASNRATELICELAGGEDVEFVDVYPTRHSEIQVALKPARIRDLIGLDVPTEEILRILTLLGFRLKSSTSNQEMIFSVPSWRHDVSIEEDLVEEVIRIVGYDKITEELPPSFGAGEYRENEDRKRNLRKTLTDLGCDEAICYSFTTTEHDEDFQFVPGLINQNLQEKFISLQSSVIEGTVRMRVSLIPGLLESVRKNFNYGQRNVKLFEIGKVFTSSSNEYGAFPTERELLAVVITGGYTLQDRAIPLRELDFYDLKGIIEAAFDAMLLPSPEFKAESIKHLRTGQAASIYLFNQPFGFIGRLSDQIAQKYKFRQPVFVAEIDLEGVLALPQIKPIYKPWSIYPSIIRDVALLITPETTFAEVKRTIQSQNFPYLHSIEFVELYVGKEIDEDKRSLTIRFEYRSPDKTLTEEEVETIHDQILLFLEQKMKIKRRFS
ncbi:MAG: phenylalanine--tRNA ligase subunit beta [Acidobacteria bacterium]|nr:MAG: phenylalanine--tRNA ligase subunit beta [Acidobacteriota bacterium]